MSDRGYLANTEHLQDEIAYIARCVERARLDPGSAEWARAGREIAVERQRINQRVAASDPARLRLPRLVTACGLTPFGRDVLMLALAPELDGPDGGSLTVGEALGVLCVTAGERLRARDAFPAPLLRFHSVEEPFASRRFRLDDRIAAFLAGSDLPDSRLEGAAYWARARLALDDLVLDGSVRRDLTSAVARGRGTFVLHGPEGAGKRCAAEAACAAQGMPLFVCDLAPLLGEVGAVPLLRCAVREALLYGASLYLDGAEALAAAGSATKRLLERELRAVSLVFLGTTEPIDLARTAVIAFRRPGPAERRLLWQRHGVAEADTAASCFRFTAGQIARVAAAACDAAGIGRACQEEAARHTGALARRVEGSGTWSDLVLPRETLAQLRELCTHVRQRARVLGDWGFGRRLGAARSTVALLSGPSGVGKTASCAILAAELGMPLLCADFGSLISKYIGESEKNISALFDEAEQSNGILLVDECESLLARRSADPRDASDKWSGLQLNHLLLRLDDYEGVVVFATNMSRNLDPALLRRVQIAIEFPFPDAAHRRRIWRAIFPPQTPLAADVDMDFLGDRFEVTGGSIRNVALAAAFSAADDGGVVTMDQVLVAMKREYQKLGRVCDRDSFDPYYEAVRLA